MGVKSTNSRIIIPRGELKQGKSSNFELKIPDFFGACGGLFLQINHFRAFTISVQLQLSLILTNFDHVIKNQ